MAMGFNLLVGKRSATRKTAVRKKAALYSRKLSDLDIFLERAHKHYLPCPYLSLAFLVLFILLKDCAPF